MWAPGDARRRCRDKEHHAVDRPRIEPQTYVNLMAQYRPAGQVSAKQYPEINRCISSEEFHRAHEAFRAAGLSRLDHPAVPEESAFAWLVRN